MGKQLTARDLLRHIVATAPPGEIVQIRNMIHWQADGKNDSVCILASQSGGIMVEAYSDWWPDPAQKRLGLGADPLPVIHFVRYFMGWAQPCWLWALAMRCRRLKFVGFGT